MINKTILLFSIIAILFILLLVALCVTILFFVKNRRGKKNRISLLNLPELSRTEERMLRKKKGYTDSVRTITTSAPEATAKIIKNWLSGKG